MTAVGLVQTAVPSIAVRVVAIHSTVLPTKQHPLNCHPGQASDASGTRETGVGIDAGAKAAFAITSNALVDAAYDGRFRDGTEAHAASGGIEVKW